MVLDPSMLPYSAVPVQSPAGVRRCDSVPCHGCSRGARSARTAARVSGYASPAIGHGGPGNLLRFSDAWILSIVSPWTRRTDPATELRRRTPPPNLNSTRNRNLRTCRAHGTSPPGIDAAHAPDSTGDQLHPGLSGLPRGMARLPFAEKPSPRRMLWASTEKRRPGPLSRAAGPLPRAVCHGFAETHPGVDHSPCSSPADRPFRPETERPLRTSSASGNPRETRSKLERHDPIERPSETSPDQLPDSRITKSPFGEVAFSKASSFSMVGTASPRS